MFETRDECIRWVKSHYTGDPQAYAQHCKDLERLALDELKMFVAKKQAIIAADEAEERLIDTQAEIAANNFMWQLKLKERYEQKREAEAKRLEPQDRRVFETAAKKYGWAINEAQFDVCRRAVGYGFTEYDLVEAVNAGKLSMAAATPAQLAQYAQERAEQRQDYLLNDASPAELRRAAVQETQQRRAEAARQHDQAQIKHREELDARVGYPALPLENLQTGEKLDSRFFVGCSNDTMRKYIRKYGAAQITKAVRERI